MESVDGVVGFGVVWTKAAASYKAEVSHLINPVNTKKKYYIKYFDTCMEY